MATGKMNYSRRQSNFISQLPDKTRDDHIRRFIALCNVDLLLPFVRIISHDENWREVEYVIEIPKTKEELQMENYRELLKGFNYPESVLSGMTDEECECEYEVVTTTK